MSKFIVMLLIGIFFLGGCASMGDYPHNSVTQVNLQKNNYKMVKPNASGASSGFVLFGIIGITAPQHTVAMTRLYESGGIKEGGAFALANVVEETTNTYLILFSIPTYRVRADIVEFVDSKEDSR